MKGFAMNVVFAVAMVLSLLAPAFGAGGTGGDFDPAPVLGGGYSFGDGFSPNWNVRNFGDQASAWINIEVKHPMLDNADWNFNVRQDDTSLWSAQLYLSGPITNEKLTLAPSMSQNTSVNKNQVWLNESLNLDYWHDDWDNTNTMRLSGYFSLSPASIESSYFNYNEYPSYSWNGEEWIPNKEPNYWYANLNLNGRFLDTPQFSGQALGASFAPAPEPATITMLATFCLALGGYCLRRHKR